MFDQYLRDIRIPVLEYFIKDGELNFRWSETIDGFDMPIEIIVDDNKKWIYPVNSWKKITSKKEYIEIDRDYYVYSKDLRIVE